MLCIKVGPPSFSFHPLPLPSSPLSIPPIPLPVRRAHEGQRKYVKAPCPHCNAVLGHADSLKKHINVVHKDGLLSPSTPSLFPHPLPCILPIPLPVHRAHEGQRKYVKAPCPHCDAVLGHADSLKKHINVVHKGGSSLLLPTTSRFPSSPPPSLSIFPIPLPVRRAHEGQRKYVKAPCPDCNAVLGHADSLKKHINVVHKGVYNSPRPNFYPCIYQCVNSISLRQGHRIVYSLMKMRMLGSILKNL